MSSIASGAERGVALRRTGAAGAGVARRAVFALPARRLLQLVLGMIWLLDAALQYQPYMFSRSFVTQIIEPAAAGNPGAVAHSVTWAAHLMLHHLAWYNAVFATVQLVIALGILYRPTVRLALSASIVWALFVWWFGEGLGGVLAGATPVMGAPGGVVLYAVIALLVWPERASTGGGPAASSLAAQSLAAESQAAGSLAAESSAPSGGASAEPTAFGGLIGRPGALAVWLALWGSFTWYLLLPGNRSPSAMGATVGAMAAGEPGWIQSVETDLGQALNHHGTEVSVVLAVLCALVALGPWSSRTQRPAVLVAVLLGAAIWVAEAFGGIFTGAGTDPNSGLLLILLACCYWPTRSRSSGGSPGAGFKSGVVTGATPAPAARPR